MKNKIITVSVIVVAVLLVISIFFDFSSSSDDDTHADENDSEVRDYTGTDKNEDVNVNEETKYTNANDNNNDDVNNNDNDNNNKNDKNKSANDINVEKVSKNTALNFVKAFHELDETADDPLQHIKNAEDYMEESFYNTVLEEYPVNPDGTDQQTLNDISAKKFGSTNSDILWDVHVKGHLESDDEDKKMDMYYVVNVANQDNKDDILVKNFWVDPTIPRDQNDNIDIFEGKKDLGKDDNAEDLSEEEKTETLLGMLNNQQQ